MNKWISLQHCVLGACVLGAAFGGSVRKGSALAEQDAGEQWTYYGHDAGGMRYSPLTQINRENVSTLKVAWTFHTGDVSDGSGDRKRSGFESTPLMVDGTTRAWCLSMRRRVLRVRILAKTAKSVYATSPVITPGGTT